MEALLNNIIAYFVSLVVNEHSDIIHRRREAKMQKVLSSAEAIKRALASKRPIQQDVAAACVSLAQDWDKIGLTDRTRPLWRLLSDKKFQADFTEWLMAGAIEEGAAAKLRLSNQIDAALGSHNAGINGEAAVFLDQLEKRIFANDMLARWRHQQSLNYLRTQVSLLRQRSDESLGKFSPEKQGAALQRYCDEAFKVWDIIDLTNLPEGDVDVATQSLLVRQLYMPLRINVEQGKDEDTELVGLEERRKIRRLREAGHRIEAESSESEKTLGIGELLQTAQRVVVLGDPGGGKTTMLRWLATAMLLRYRADPASHLLPDVETLPIRNWIPVLIRCRDLGDADLCRCFSDFLGQHLLKSTLRPEEAQVMQALILEKIASGQVLLMVDGLDEITNPQVRVRFCQELERTAVRYPDAKIVVTSRIVGYRDMPYRMGSDFKHGVIAELEREHKDLFAKRWIEATEQRQPPDERAKRERELITALHASDRIERLTGNPMLLTTLALVKRKVGKLPSRRNKLYAEAVAVLLNWNPGFYTPIDDAEAIPQLEYLAFEMCRRGVQRLSHDQIMELLEQFRREYPSVRAVRLHSELEFLALLEARSSILIKAGNIWSENHAREEPAWEFRHLTFQEYLAAQALIDGKYPNRDKSLSLAMQVAPLAGIVKAPDRSDETLHLEEADLESEVPESWREALRLLVADCKDDDVDAVLEAIMTPLAPEDQQVTRRTRAVLAALCLADEPNVGEEIAQRILDELNEVARPGDDALHFQSPLGTAVIQLSYSQWAQQLKRTLVGRFLSEVPPAASVYGGLWGMVVSEKVQSDKLPNHQYVELITALSHEDRIESTAAALAIMDLAYSRKLENLHPKLIPTLLALFKRGPGEASAAAWALGWLNDKRDGKAEKRLPYWQPTDDQIRLLCTELRDTPYEYVDTQFWIMRILGDSGQHWAADYVAPFVAASEERPRTAAVTAIGKIGNDRHIPMLRPLLTDPNAEVVISAARALSVLGDEAGFHRLLQIWREDTDFDYEVHGAILMCEKDFRDRALLSHDIDGHPPMISAGAVVDEARINACAVKLSLDRKEILRRYHFLCEKYNLKLQPTIP